MRASFLLTLMVLPFLVSASGAKDSSDLAIQMAYEEYYPPDGTDLDSNPIILFHGIYDSKKTWIHFGPEIAKATERKVYAVDTRNHGESPWSSNFSFDVVNKDVDQFFDDHNITKAILIGHSLGGRIAMNYALYKPERVEKLIVEEMTPSNYSAFAVGAMKQLARVLRRSLEVIPVGVDEEVARKVVHDFLVSFTSEDYVPVKDIYEISAIPLKKDGNKYSWQMNLDVIERVLRSREVRKPVSGTYMGDSLFIYGTHSPLLKVGRDEYIKKLFPRSLKLGFEGGFHVIHHEFPHDFKREVTKFINELIVPVSR